jgi:hypothetical protein
MKALRKGHFLKAALLKSHFCERDGFVLRARIAKLELWSSGEKRLSRGGAETRGDKTETLLLLKFVFLRDCAFPHEILFSG